MFLFSLDCPVGVYGRFCNVSCQTPYCLDNVCERNTSTCRGCLTGRFGLKCNTTCPTCRDGSCEQNNGMCLDGCIDGYYGSRCDQECTQCVTCSQDSGLCTSCTEGFFGQSCSQSCSSNCLTTGTGNTCHVETGTCDSGACVDGFYGDTCTTACNSNCLPGGNGLRRCEHKSGNCTTGCVNLRYGGMCDKVCNSYCHDQSCDRVVGYCGECLKEEEEQGPNCPDAGECLLCIMI